MKELQVFKNEQFGNIRVFEKDGEPWFVGKDVAGILGYQNGSRDINAHVDEEDKLKYQISTSGQTREQIIINESGLYCLILSSKLPQAKQFKRWVTNEVLPSIRRTGGYIMDQQAVSDIELFELSLNAIKENRSRIEEVDTDLQEFKKEMPLLGVEESRITCAVQKKGVKCLGGKDSAAYRDKSTRSKVYADIYRQLKREFGVTSYKAIKRNQCDHAVRIIERYETPYVIAEKIKSLNLQVSMGGGAK